MLASPVRVHSMLGCVTRKTRGPHTVRLLSLRVCTGREYEPLPGAALSANCFLIIPCLAFARRRARESRGKSEMSCTPKTSKSDWLIFALRAVRQVCPGSRARRRARGWRRERAREVKVDTHSGGRAPMPVLPDTDSEPMLVGVGARAIQSPTNVWGAHWRAERTLVAVVAVEEAQVLPRRSFVQSDVQPSHLVPSLHLRAWHADRLQDCPEHEATHLQATSVRRGA